MSDFIKRPIGPPASSRFRLTHRASARESFGILKGFLFLLTAPEARRLGLFLCVGMAGCLGYSTHALMRADLQRVAILPVENSTIQPGIGDEMTDLLAEAFERDRRLRVSPLDAADLSVNINLMSYNRTPAAYSGDEVVTAYDIVISAAVTAEDRIRTEEYYSGNLSARVTYEPDSESEESAVDRCLVILSDDIVRAIVTKW